jgi:hypothetical protein
MINTEYVVVLLYVCKYMRESVHCTVLASRRLYSLEAPLLRLTEIIYIRLADPLYEIKSSNVLLKEECGGCDTFSGRIHSTSHCPPRLGKIWNWNVLINVTRLTVFLAFYHCFLSLHYHGTNGVALNTELDLQSLFGLVVHICTVLIWAHIRGRCWSAKIEDISLWPPDYISLT